MTPIVQHLIALPRRRALSARLAGMPELSGLVLGRSLQQGHRTAVWAARLDGRAVVVKWTFGPCGAEVTRIQQENLAHLHPRMASGPLRVPAPIAFVPEAGIAVMERAPGRRLTDLLRRARPERRAELVAQAGDWLAAYAAPRARRADFGPFYWAEMVRQGLAQVPAGPDRALAEAIRSRLSDTAPDVAGSPVTQARIHGDLTARNLILDGTALWGTDLDMAAWWPLAKDAARFLVQLTATRPAPDGPRHRGVARADIDAFGRGGVLRFEAEGVLDFFLGVEVARRLATISGNRRARRATRALARDWLAG